jgi:hypothetical protein
VYLLASPATALRLLRPSLTVRFTGPNTARRATQRRALITVTMDDSGGDKMITGGSATTALQDMSCISASLAQLKLEDHEMSDVPSAGAQGVDQISTLTAKLELEDCKMFEDRDLGGVLLTAGTQDVDRMSPLPT